MGALPQTIQTNFQKMCCARYVAAFEAVGAIACSESDATLSILHGANPAESM